jgi:hypothetical protein
MHSAPPPAKPSYFFVGVLQPAAEDHRDGAHGRILPEAAAGVQPGEFGCHGCPAGSGRRGPPAPARAPRWRSARSGPHSRRGTGSPPAPGVARGLLPLRSAGLLIFPKEGYPSVVTSSVSPAKRGCRGPVLERWFRSFPAEELKVGRHRRPSRSEERNPVLAQMEYARKALGSQWQRHLTSEKRISSSNSIPVRRSDCSLLPGYNAVCRISSAGRLTWQHQKPFTRPLNSVSSRRRCVPFRDWKLRIQDILEAIAAVEN